LQPLAVRSTLGGMSQAAFHATVFVCQGSPEPAWREPYDRLVDVYRLADPDARIELAFCEAMAPGLTEVIDELAIDLCDRIRIVTLDLAPDGHGDRILAFALQAAARRWPEMHFVRVSGTASGFDPRQGTEARQGKDARRAVDVTDTDPTRRDRPARCGTD